MNTNIGLLGQKIGMSHAYDDEGNRYPVTVIHAGACVVTAVKTAEKEKYTALQVGAGKIKDKHARKPQKKQFEAVSRVPEIVREFRVSQDVSKQFKVGDPLTVGIFKKGQYVDVRGRTIGKGFQGVVKRYAFGGFVMTRGSHESFRGPGSVGARTWPGRIYKGRKMPGHMGHRNRTILNLKILGVDPEQNVLMIQGSVPGPKHQWVEIRLATKKVQA
jgi:large subunit ribosomal protein L3